MAMNSWAQLACLLMALGIWWLAGSVKEEEVKRAAAAAASSAQTSPAPDRCHCAAK